MKKILLLPSKVTNNNKLREFQFKLLQISGNKHRDVQK